MSEEQRGAASVVATSDGGGADRTYFHVTTRPHAPRRAWHALDPDASSFYDGWRHVVGLCGFDKEYDPAVSQPDTADRLPSTAHFCGNCSRTIAARTDVEMVTGLTEDAAPDRALVAEWDATLPAAPV